MWELVIEGDYVGGSKYLGTRLPTIADVQKHCLGLSEKSAQELIDGNIVVRSDTLYKLRYTELKDSTQALRYNSGKPQLSFLLEAPKALEGTARVLEFGAQKYARSNWKKGLPKEQIMDSLLRHLAKLANGEEFDEESGLHHSYHITCNALFLAELYGMCSERGVAKEVSV